MSFVYVVQRDARCDMAYESTPVIGVCATERQAFRNVVADIVNGYVDACSGMNALIPSSRQHCLAIHRREWTSFRYVPKYWVSRWPVDSVDGMERIFDRLADVEFRVKCTVVVDLNARIVKTCARFDEDDMVTAFFTDLRREDKVEALLNDLRRENHEGRVLIR